MECTEDFSNTQQLGREIGQLLSTQTLTEPRRGADSTKGLTK
jgi:hypothetical protein